MLTEIATGRKKDSSRLIWDTKPRRAPNPKDIEFQTAELVIPNPARDQAVLSSYALPALGDLDRSKTNRLIWGDNLLAMQALLSSGYEGQINLIYIDPPFWTGENYYANVTIGGESITKSPSVIERLAYKDYWQGGIDSYLDMLYPRLHLMKRLLVDDGAIFIHTDWHIGHYVKIIADEVFGKENFRNEIVWRRTSSHNDPNKFGNVHESILFYTKSENWCWTEPKIEYEDWYKERYYRYKEETGRRFFSRDLTAPAHGHSSGIYNWKGANPPP